ncbi:hypothetical protein ACUNWD_19145 [Sunxiuqinia sp. A32]|uniref:hypothetical protein n=1 Tax=Sunxiuqinia sp. A32 TaxID=3461496 RepID=UPI004045360C
MTRERYPLGSYSHNFIHEKNICQVTGQGNVNSEMTTMEMNDIVMDPQFSNSMQLIVDLRKINFHPTYNEIIHIKDHLNFLKQYFKNEIAVVASESFYYIAFLICEMSSIKLKAFKDCEKAKEWLQRNSF